MKDRIIEFLKTENKSSAQLADEIGVQPSSISHILSGRNNPSLDFVMKMLGKYPSISTDWLLFGKGEMYRDAQLNDLFDSGATHDNKAEQLLKDNREAVNFHIKDHSVPDSGPLKEKKTGSGADKTTRIVCFFNDDTFKEYFPGDE
jgi:transcriptional regulator with XRE-family HTH domain